MDLTSKDVLHLSKLANLPLSKGEVEKLKVELTEVLHYVDELKIVNTKDTQPTSQPGGLENVKRDDEVKSGVCLKTSEALSGTEDVEADLFLVPAILEKKAKH